MSILIDSATKLLVQNITGREGTFHTHRMLAYGTKIVAGTAPGRGGQEVEGVPVFDSVKQAVQATSPNTSIIFVPAPYAADAIVEAADNGIRLIVCITEGIPVLDMVKVYAHVRSKGCRLIGPNCPGIITPGHSKVGIMPQYVYRPGVVGVVSRSGTLTYEIASELTSFGMGVSTCVGVGGDPIIGSSFNEMLMLFETDAETKIGPSHRRDRRVGGGRGGHVHLHRYEEARGGVRGRQSGSAREAHGSRGRHHLGEPGHRRRQDQGSGGRRSHRGGHPARDG